MNSRSEAGLAGKGWLVAMVGLAVVAVCVFGLTRLGNDNAKPVNTVKAPPTATLTTEPVATPTPSPSDATTPVEIVRPKCVGPKDLTNVEGLDLDTLPADCGTEPVPVTSSKPLGLACGGKYPSIMYKTVTSGHKTTICGKNSSGEFNYMVTKPNGGAAIDMVAEYVPGLDAFVAKKDGTTYTVEAYNGSLTVTKDGKSAREVAKEWISLDNESDSD